MSEEDDTFLEIEDLKELDLMRKPGIKNKVLNTIEEWKACRDILCPNNSIKRNTCTDYKSCDKRVYDELHKK